MGQGQFGLAQSPSPALLPRILPHTRTAQSKKPAVRRQDRRSRVREIFSPTVPAAILRFARPIHANAPPIPASVRRIPPLQRLILVFRPPIHVSAWLLSVYHASIWVYLWFHPLSSPRPPLPRCSKSSLQLGHASLRKMGFSPAGRSAPRLLRACIWPASSPGSLRLRLADAVALLRNTARTAVAICLQPPPAALRGRLRRVGLGVPPKQFLCQSSLNKLRIFFTPAFSAISEQNPTPPPHIVEGAFVLSPSPAGRRSGCVPA